MDNNWTMQDIKQYMTQWVHREDDWSNLIKVYAVMHTLEEMQKRQAGKSTR